jgi:hypothetical protein
VDVGTHFRRELSAGDVGLDETRCDRIDAYAVRSELARHRFREAEHAGLCRAVMRAAEDAAAALRRDRRHAPDAAALLFFHLRNHGLRHVQRAAQIHVLTGCVMPALLMSASMRPHFSMTAPAAATQAALSVTSHARPG